MTDFPKTSLNRIKREPQRGHYDRETIYPILDEAIIAHVGFAEKDQPFVIPINFARIGDTLVLHGANSSRLIKHIQAGLPVCVEVTLLDGLVLARSVFNHSVNYRSVIVFGTGRIVEEKEKMAALEAITEHLIPGRWREVRLPNRKEMNATSVVSIKIDLASAKMRSGPPVDDKADYGLPTWAGVIPLQETALPPVRDLLMTQDLPAPEYVSRYTRKGK